MNICLRSDLDYVYIDPRIRRDIVAYIAETHASSACSHALPQGRRVPAPNPDADTPWCEWCSTSDPEKATLIKTPTGWIPK